MSETQPSPPDPKDIHKFEVREQPGITKPEAEAATGWLNLTQLLEKIVFILNGHKLDEVMALALTSDDIQIGERALRENKRWKVIFEEAKKHHEDVLGLFIQQRDMAEKMRGLIQVVAKLKTDESIIAEAERLNRVLDALEAHRKSGLLEIISKL